MPPRKPRAKSPEYAKSGTLIAVARRDLEFSQQSLADELSKELGKAISRQRVQNWEKGVALPRPPEMSALATVLKLTVDEITRGARASLQHNLELDPSAQTIGKAWTLVPRTGQAYIADQLRSMLQLYEDHPELAAAVFKEFSAAQMGRIKEHEKLMELLQEISRKMAVKPPVKE